MFVFFTHLSGMQPLPTTNERPFVFWGLRFFSGRKFDVVKRTWKVLALGVCRWTGDLLRVKLDETLRWLFFFFVISGQPKLQADNWESQCPGEQPAAVKITTRQRKKNQDKKYGRTETKSEIWKGNPVKKKKWEELGLMQAKMTSNSRPPCEADHKRRRVLDSAHY